MKKEFIVRNYTSNEEAITLERLGLPINTADIFNILLMVFQNRLQRYKINLIYARKNERKLLLTNKINEIMKKEFIVRNYTSNEEAITLERLGLPINTADMYYYDHEISVKCPESIRCAHYFTPEDLLKPFSKRMPFIVYPCWSAGQLLLINKLCNLDCKSIKYGCNNDKAVMDVIMDVFKHSDFDFNILK